MSFRDRMVCIGRELRSHAPFTLAGALGGIAFMLVFSGLGQSQSRGLFAVFHPLHVALSAMVTASLFELHRKAKNFVVIFVIGYVGSIGVATLSDCVIPYFGESVLGVMIPTESATHSHQEGGQEAEGTELHEPEQEHHHPSLHLGFIEEWYLVNPAAVLGILIAFFRPRTKLPHAGHILISTWASSAHMLMNTDGPYSMAMLAGMFIALFVAVWLPCCVSDIVFPMMFVKGDGAHIGDTCVLCGRKEAK